ncbi:MAG: MXAN_5187 C-terminal domain-containing protein [Terriglobia bacterium]
MTLDEEMNRLEEDLRHLKIEYEAYFNGGAPRAPNDLALRVERAMKRYGGGGDGEMSLRQRFRLNQIAQSYAVHNDLWQKKLRIKEEGGAARGREAGSRAGEFRIICADPDQEPDKVEWLFQALVQAKATAGEPADSMDLRRFAVFMRDKARQCRESLACDRVEFSVGVDAGRVKLRAAKAD